MVLNNKSGQDQIVMNTIDNSIVVNKNNEKIILENGVNVGFVDKEICAKREKRRKRKKKVCIILLLMEVFGQQCLVLEKDICQHLLFF
jgi:hypothetical protein